MGVYIGKKGGLVMRKQVMGSLLIAGALFCAILTGCADKEECRDNSVVNLQDMAVDMASVGVDSGKKQAGTEADNEGTVEKQETENESVASAGESSGEIKKEERESEKMNSDRMKELLAVFPNSLEELTALEEEYPVYVILHGVQNSGEENLEEFWSKLEAEETAELIAVQFTVEGDAILDYYYYDGSLLYRLEDISRDAFGGNGEKYFETIYESAWFSEEADTEGNLYLSFYGLQEGDMAVELFRSNTGQKCPDFRPDYDDKVQDGIGEPLSTLPPWAKPPAPQEKNGAGTTEPDAETPVASFEAEICDLPLAK